MIDIIELQIKVGPIGSLLTMPLVTRCVVFNPYIAINYRFWPRDGNCLYGCFHIPTGACIWRATERKAILQFTRNLIDLNLNWDFGTPDLIPLETLEPVKVLINHWDKQYENEDEDEDEFFYEKLWRKSTTNAYNES